MPRAGTRCSRASRAPRPSCRSSTCAPCTPRPAPSPRPAGRRTSCSSKTAGELVAACPLYLKDHSYGEYVFDWAWADAYRRHGLDYYPKLARRDPVHAGARAAPAGARRTSSGCCCCARIEAIARQAGSRRRTCCSSTTPTRPRRSRPAGRCAARSSSTGATARPTPYADFADFLASLQREKRKKIQQERRRVADAGVTLHRARPATRSRRPTGTSSTAATPSPTARTTRRPT